MRPFVIANPDCVLGMSLAGIGGKVVSNADELSEALNTALKDKTIAMILISSDVAKFAREKVDELKVTSISPLIIEVPGLTRDAEALSLIQMVQRSIGVSLGGLE
ncbi:MAG: V-type ATP synthase subunit F [Anaerolineae bacterium]